jgi:hypothetical protein
MTANLGSFNKNQALQSSPQLYRSAFAVETGASDVGASAEFAEADDFSDSLSGSGLFSSEFMID